MVIEVRDATAGDFDIIYQFINELQNKTFDKQKLKTLYEENIADPKNIYLVAIDGESTCGYLSCHIQTLLHHAGQVAEVQEMFVTPKDRSRGVGKLLVDAVKDRARKMGAVQLEVTTRLIRKDAIRFYVRESFQDSHKKLVYYFNDQKK